MRFLFPYISLTYKVLFPLYPNFSPVPTVHRSFDYAAVQALKRGLISSTIMRNTFFFFLREPHSSDFCIKNKGSTVPDLLCSSPPCLLIPAMLLDPPEEWGEWLKLLEFEGDAGLLANAGNLTGLVPLLTDI